MQIRIILISLFSMAGILSAQNVRPSTQVDTTATGPATGPAVSSDANLRAVIYADSGSNTLHVVTSDGRGIQWSAPVRVDNDPGIPPAAKFTQSDSVCVVGKNIYVAWEDERNGTSNEDLYFNSSNDGGVTWNGEVRIDKGTAAGVGAVRDWRMLARHGTPDDSIYFLISTDPTTSANEELYLNTSHDGGVTFSGANPVSSLGAGTEDVDAIDMAVFDSTVHVVWQGDRHGGASLDDVFYRRSADGGATWQIADMQLDSSGPSSGDAEGELTIASTMTRTIVAWQEELRSATNEEIRVTVSHDGGVTWTTDGPVTAADPVTVDADGAQVILSFGNLISVFWADDRTGRNEVYVATAATPSRFTEMQVSTAGGEFPRIASRNKGFHEHVHAVSYTTGNFPNEARVSYTFTGGSLWSTGVTTSDNAGFDVDFAEVGVNDRYGNAIAAWLSDDQGANHVYVGGFRPQTLTPVGTPITAGATISFDVSNYGGGEPSRDFFVLISGGSGNFKLPLDNRNTGLANDAILDKSSRIQALAGQLNQQSGTAGSTGTLTIPSTSKLPIGTMLHMIAFTKRNNRYGSITDVVVETVQ